MTNYNENQHMTNYIDAFCRDTITELFQVLRLKDTEPTTSVIELDDYLNRKLHMAYSLSHMKEISSTAACKHLESRALFNEHNRILSEAEAEFQRRQPALL